MCALVGKRRRPLRRSLSAPAKSPSRSSDLAAYTTFTSGRCPPGCLPAYRASAQPASRARGVGLEIVRGRRAGGRKRRRVRRAPRRRRGPTHRRGGARGGGTRSRAGARRARRLDPRGERIRAGRNPVPARTREAPPAPTRAPRTSRRGAEAERRRRPRECASYPFSPRGRVRNERRSSARRIRSTTGGVGRGRERQFRREPFRFRGARVPFDARSTFVYSGASKMAPERWRTAVCRCPRPREAPRETHARAPRARPQPLKTHGARP